MVQPEPSPGGTWNVNVRLPSFIALAACFMIAPLFAPASSSFTLRITQPARTLKNKNKR